MKMPSTSILLSILLLVGRATEVTAQQSDTVRIVTASFAEPERPADPARSQTLGGCLNVFGRLISLHRYDHPPDVTPAHDTLLMGEQSWIPYPPEAVAAARSCYHATYRKPSDIEAADMGTAFSLAVAMDDDSLATVIGARLLAPVGQYPTKRAATLSRLIHQLVGGGGDGRHMNKTCLALARQYLAQLEALGPRYVLQWMDANETLERASSVAAGFDLASDARVDAALSKVHHTLGIIHGIPPGTLVGADAEHLRDRERNARIYGVQRLTYIKTLDRADLKRYLQLVDSAWPTGKRPWLVGTMATPITADYWFGTPSNAAPPAVPVAGAVSLIMFINPSPVMAAASTSEKDAMLRRLHSRYPELQIILIAVTKGFWENESLLGHPEREAQLMYHYVHDSLQVPGIMGIIRGKQQVVTPDGKTLPVQIPELDRYRVGVTGLHGQRFLVDRDGMIVDEGMSLVALAPRLVTQSTRRKP